MPQPAPLPTPPYTPTDIITAIGVVIGFALDVLTGYGVIPAVDPVTRVSFIGALTLLTIAGSAAFISNRRVKVQAQAQVAIAQATALSTPAPAPVTPAPGPEPLTPAGGGIYVITPYGSGGP